MKDVDVSFLTDGSIHNHNNNLGRDDESGKLAGRKSDASLEPSRKKTQRVDLRLRTDDVEALNTAANYMNLNDMRQDMEHVNLSGRGISIFAMFADSESHRL
jgi:hypothetical protein